jgi:hypothetical protein
VLGQVRTVGLARLFVAPDRTLSGFFRFSASRVRRAWWISFIGEADFFGGW